MAFISNRILAKLWYATEESTWDSLLSNLDEIHAYDIITTDQWEDLHWAISQLAENEIDFPDSIGELAVMLDPYM